MSLSKCSIFWSSSSALLGNNSWLPGTSLKYNSSSHPGLFVLYWHIWMCEIVSYFQASLELRKPWGHTSGTCNQPYTAPVPFLTQMGELAETVPVLWYRVILTCTNFSMAFPVPWSLGCASSQELINITVFPLIPQSACWEELLGNWCICSWDVSSQIFYLCPENVRPVYTSPSRFIHRGLSFLNSQGWWKGESWRWSTCLCWAFEMQSKKNTFSLSSAIPFLYWGHWMDQQLTQGANTEGNPRKKHKKAAGLFVLTGKCMCSEGVHTEQICPWSQDHTIASLKPPPTPQDEGSVKERNHWGRQGRKTQPSQDNDTLSIKQETATIWRASGSSTHLVWGPHGNSGWRA